MSDFDLNVDLDEIVRKVQKEERVKEIRNTIDSWKKDSNKNTAQRHADREIVVENLKAAVSMKLMTPTQAEQYLIAKLEEERSAKMEGLHIHKDGYYVDRQGNKYDEDGNYVE